MVCEERHVVSNPAFLDSLEEVDLRRPFVGTPTSSLIPPLLQHTLGTTPSTNTTNLPTPEPARAPFLHYESDTQFIFYPIEWDNSMAPPAAPLLRDMDTFTEGTGVGSFDFSLESTSKGGSSECSFPNGTGRQSVAFSPEDPLRSIETWRNDVLRSTLASSTEASPVRGSGLAAPHTSQDFTYHRVGKRHRSSTNESLPVDGTAWQGSFGPRGEITDRTSRRQRASTPLPLI
ncbi:hypothetical protein SERLA73DRAFT_175734 [Serpula lacrymans var. lacrymans S7.3]|uniref:Uncharacterized protein n=2 Tax=Serpula lacrymans var. lacrymans TaxID=341189 RepID=F8PLA1_SERL3|nr:uncharacterized protein SERLADRAFT_458314 [Serpula lacrymans var. lacrymans S7.9]EGO04009.1 hypothetical protein SERLA73DRAFT_175734 [Serpula lacrymans var. lacrymans S7.3]EGO29929.1 hypothetical protein SERLADRAFT_458314 [Serpula lacrymans var. lacrymans S7.9]